MLHRIGFNLRNATRTQQQIATITKTVVGASKSLEAEISSTNTADIPISTLPGQFPKYTQEQSNTILGILNNRNLQELLSYEISKARAGKLLAWQTRNGPLQEVSDILQVEGFGLKVVDKLCRSLLSGPTVKEATAKTTRPRTAPFITPVLNTERQQRIRSCVSVRIGVSSVTWARLEVHTDENAPCLLTDWQHHDITERKLHLNDLVQRCHYIDHLIPAADCYLFESPQTAAASNNPGNAEQQNINIQKAQIAAVLGFALSARRCLHDEQEDHDAEELKRTSSQPNVFYLRRFLTARLFSHLVGTERVSSEETIMNLMRTYYNIEQQPDYLLENQEEVAGNSAAISEEDTRISFRGNVQFPTDLREMFARAERFHREFLGQSLLLNLTFVRLVLLQDPQSLALASRNSNKDKDALTLDN